MCYKALLFAQMCDCTFGGFLIYKGVPKYIPNIWNMQGFAQKILLFLLFYGNISMSKTKYTNNARLPEIIGAFGLITIYKNLRSFGSPKRHLHKICGKDTTKNWNMQTLFYNFDIFLQIFSFSAQNGPK